MTSTEAEIIEKLKGFANQGLSYYQAKENLINQGYAEKDIKLVSYDYTYGEKPPAPDPVKQALEDNPELAAKIAKGMAQELDETENINKVDISDNILPDIAMKEVEASKNSLILRIFTSWWFWLVTESAAAGIIWAFSLSPLFYGALIVILIIAFTIRELIRPRLTK